MCGEIRHYQPSELEKWAQEQYFDDKYPDHAYDPDRLSCGHIAAYQCDSCGKCYQCRHIPIVRGNGEHWWKCPNGKQHRIPRSL